MTKKTITVRYFALFRENAGMAEHTLTIEASVAADVFEATREHHRSTEPLGHCKIAINDELRRMTVAAELEPC